ncbi:hypothetical protein [Gordonia sp. 852002-10350_SCH5691597]|uniref:hypothetical protein n=1 Tax=Gordonia sp. 852002-10350_SCH5691597 TaxID=1834085 RepID=UPI0007E9F95A|nr:hypothetical protein [Gordonia sp. 852002-10350_SCH5691597]OBA62142.1 hypothetical protein A5777_02870 [Gordonia sp. 852002-10350_SCH5691597]
MGRLCLALMLAGCAIALLAAALLVGMSGAADGSYYVSWSSPAGLVRASEFVRYLVVAAVGAALGAACGVLLYLSGIRMRAHRGFGRTVLAGLLGCVIGVLPALIAVGMIVELPEHFPPLALYGICGITAYALSVAAVYLALRVSGDPATAPTVVATALLLPVGAVIATVVGVGSAWMLGFSTVMSTWVVVVVAVTIIVMATFVTARALGLRRQFP